mgnify:CR=1 FL=1
MPTPSEQEQRSFRLHDVPADCTEEDIAEEVHKSLDVKPESVMLATYKEEKKKDVKLAIVEGDKCLLDAAKGRRFLMLEYKRCRIDTNYQGKADALPSLQATAAHQ